MTASFKNCISIYFSCYVCLKNLFKKRSSDRTENTYFEAVFTEINLFTNMFDIVIRGRRNILNKTKQNFCLVHFRLFAALFFC